MAGLTTAFVIETFKGMFLLIEQDALRVGNVTSEGSSAIEAAILSSDTVMTCFVASSVNVNDPSDTEMFSMPMAKGSDVVSCCSDGGRCFVEGAFDSCAFPTGRPLMTTPSVDVFVADIRGEWSSRVVTEMRLDKRGSSDTFSETFSIPSAGLFVAASRMWNPFISMLGLGRMLADTLSKRTGAPTVFVMVFLISGRCWAKSDSICEFR